MDGRRRRSADPGTVVRVHLAPHLDEPALRTLALRQHAVVTRDDLWAAGVSAGAVRHEVVAGRWRTHGPRAVVLHNGPLSDRHLL